MKHIKLKINTKSQKYPIIIGSNLVSNLSNIAKNNSVYFKKYNKDIGICENNFIFGNQP